MDALTVDAALKGLAALVGAAFAATILAAGQGNRANRWLALFLLLIAGNQAAETARALVADEATALAWFRVATVFACLDPAALWTFVAAHPAFRTPVRARFVGPVWVAGAGLAAWTLTLDGLPDGVSRFALLLGGFTYLVYGALLLALARDFLSRPAEPAHRFLVPAMMFVFAPVAVNLLGLGVGAFALAVHGRPTFEGLLWGDALAILLLLGLVGAFAFLSAGAPPRVRRVMMGGVVASVLLAFLLNIYNFAVVVTEGLGWPTPEGLVLVGRSGAPIRWLVFGALVSMATLRHDMLGLSLAARRRAARVLVALAFLSLGALVLVSLALAVPGSGLDVRPVDVLLLAGAVLLSQGFRALVDRVAWKVYGVPMRADVEGRHETYRLAAEQAAAQGRRPAGDARLARLREELGVDPSSAEVLERLAEETSAGALSEGQRVGGRYRVGPLVGSGAESRAFLAHDERLDRPVVLKEVPQTPDAREDLALREARIAGGLAHPNVLVVHDALRRRGFTVLVAEHAAGGSLSARLAKGPLPEKDARRILEEILAGLAAVHAKGVVHRDLKPSNVLLSQEGTAKIADFGIARLRAGGTTVGVEGGLLGTPEFMAPELRRGMDATEASDVYALGLLGRALFSGAPPPDVARVLDRALAERPDARPSAAAMLDALRAGPPRQDQ